MLRPSASAGVQRARFVLDIAAGVIEVYDVTGEHFSAAEQLIGRHSYQRRLRTLDALQLAVALDLSRGGLVDHFMAADQSLAARSRAPARTFIAKADWSSRSPKLEIRIRRPVSWNTAETMGVPISA